MNEKMDQQTPQLDWDRIFALRCMIWMDCFPQKEELTKGSFDISLIPNVVANNKRVKNAKDYQEILTLTAQRELPIKFTDALATLAAWCFALEGEMHEKNLLVRDDPRKHLRLLCRLKDDLQTFLRTETRHSESAQQMVTSIDDCIKNPLTAKSGPLDNFYRKDTLLDLFVYLQGLGKFKNVDCYRLIIKALLALDIAKGSVTEESLAQTINRSARSFMEWADSKSLD